MKSSKKEWRQVSGEESTIGRLNRIGKSALVRNALQIPVLRQNQQIKGKHVLTVVKPFTEKINEYSLQRISVDHG